MKGDFSRLHYDARDNDTGVMHQQGRVLTDQDWNAGDQINRHLRQQLGRDAIGAHVAAVPSEHRDSLKVVGASSDGSAVTVEINPGQVWVDGLHLTLPPEAVTPSVQAAYLSPPSAETSPRDAVILEVWEEAVNAFEFPDQMIEPALGGVDTTERIRLRHRLRLLRLEDGDSCHNLTGKLADDCSARGKLTVTPAPTLAVSGACPIEMNGGYTGFEHYLYRIEITEPDAGNARFVWSRFGGGLVGRGVYDSASSAVNITANDQMINHCGLSNFYLEAGDRDGLYFTADATLAADGLLTLTNISGTWPGNASDEAFFRLWDGIKPVSDFAAVTELEMGIQLQLDAATSDNSNYKPGDYWSFPVRAAGATFATSQWPVNAAPQGVFYHRVPLGILQWDINPLTDPGSAIVVHDCRRVFDPLTQLDSCCTFTVGDGTHSHGDFESIQQAVNHLPSAGGRVCVLPGEYRENISIQGDNIRVHGCGSDSRVVAAVNAPVFHIVGASGIKIESLRVEAHPDAEGVLIGKNEKDTKRIPSRIYLGELEIKAAKDSAIKAMDARWLTILRCNIMMADQNSPWPGIFSIADDVLMEHNTVQVLETGQQRDDVFLAGISAGRGGIQIGGTSERVSLIDNHISGGIGNGITLGSLEFERKPGIHVPGRPVDGKCEPCKPGDNSISPGNGKPESVTMRAGGALYDIRIERNRIEQMGLNGIGVAGFFDLSEQDEFISVVGLDILGNTIRECLNRLLKEPSQDRLFDMAYGGISLADVEMLRLYDNRIENNGPDHLQAVCGVFVLHGEGLDISRNHILNNGAKNDRDTEDANKGLRGGIVIRYALPGMTDLEINDHHYPRQNGVPAVRIHDNVVSQPLGQALLLGALGPVSIQGNSLTSRGIVPGFSLGLFASTVMLLNLGISNEFYGQIFAFAAAHTDSPRTASAAVRGEMITTSKTGLDDFGIGQYLANGNVIFNDNQVVADLMEVEVSTTMSSVLIISLDDISFADNQLDASFLIDLMISNAIVLGMSVRINDNRFKESLILSLFSAISFGLLFNHTVDNQATHCIFAKGLLHERVRDNQILMATFCEQLGSLKHVLDQHIQKTHLFAAPENQG